MEASHSLIPNLTDTEKETLLFLAKESISCFVNNKKFKDIDDDLITPTLQEEGASFVTLKIANNLRGCIGSIVAHRPLYLDVVYNALASARDDYRFAPLTKEEFKGINISISVLGKEEEIIYTYLNDLLNKITPNEDGLILQNNNLTGVFLPSVWEEIPKKEEFLAHLCLKAGFHPSAWHNNIKIYKYRCLYFS